MSDVDDLRTKLAAFTETTDQSRVDAWMAAITEHPDVLASAVHWSKTGEFLAEPRIAGYSPQRLNRMGMEAPGPFTWLVRLRTHPEEALAFLKQDFGRGWFRHGTGVWKRQQETYGDRE